MIYAHVKPYRLLTLKISHLKTIEFYSKNDFDLNFMDTHNYFLGKATDEKRTYVVEYKLHYQNTKSLVSYGGNDKGCEVTYTHNTKTSE